MNLNVGMTGTTKRIIYEDRYTTERGMTLALCVITEFLIYALCLLLNIVP